MKQVWQTVDGATFADKSDAKNHETNLFQAWLDCGPLVNCMRVYEKLADLDGEVEWSGTPSEIYFWIMRLYFLKTT